MINQIRDPSHKLIRDRLISLKLYVVLYFPQNTCYLTDLKSLDNSEVIERQTINSNDPSCQTFVSVYYHACIMDSRKNIILHINLNHHIIHVQTWKRSERSTPESPPSNGEETVNSKDNGIAEDVVVKDYEQPHRKPPIHNWEP